jgi:hypothetical protein
MSARLSATASGSTADEHVSFERSSPRTTTPGFLGSSFDGGTRPCSPRSRGTALGAPDVSSAYLQRTGQRRTDA